MPVALPVMIGLSAEQLLAGTVLGAAAAVGVGAAVDAFRRGGAEAVATGREGLASLAEMVSDAVAGALLPVGVGPPPNWNPLGDALAAVKGAADSIWDALNKNLLPSSGVSGDWTFTNNTGQTLQGSFQTFGTYGWPPGHDTWLGLVGKSADLYEANPWINSWALYSNQAIDFPPGVSGGSIKHYMTGSPLPNSRNDFWEATVNGEKRQSGIFGYDPGRFLSYALLVLPNQVSATANGATIAKPRKVEPKKVESAAPALALPAPLPAAVGRWEDFLVITAPEPASDREPTAKAAPGQLPLPLGLPAAPAPMKATGFDTAGLPIPQAAPAVKPTSTTAHQVGNLTIPAKAPQATLQGIAEEVGRIEQKLEIVLNPGNQAPGIDWMDNLAKIAELLFSATAAGDYELTSGCELDANRQRIIKRAAYGGSIDRIGVIENKIDALAQLMQHSKDLKQPACIPPTKPSTVTVTAYQLPPYT